MAETVESKRKASKAPSKNRKPKMTGSTSKRQRSSGAAKQSKRPLVSAATTPSPDSCKLSNDESLTRVRFDSVHIKEYPLALGDFDEDNHQPMDYALALDWPQQQDSESRIITQPLDTYESTKTIRYKSLVEYSEHGRLTVTDRCKRLLQTMDVSELAAQVGQRYGKTTIRGIGRVEHDLQAFLESAEKGDTARRMILPPFVKKA